VISGRSEQLKTQKGELGPFSHCRWCLSIGPIPDHRHNTCSSEGTSRQVATVNIKALCVSPGGAAVGANLGESSKYSNESF